MEKSTTRSALAAAFPYTVPIMTAFIFLGMAYGFYATAAGFPYYYPIITAAVVFGGSLEFVTVAMLLGTFAPLATFLMAFIIQARHLFYGLAMLDRFRSYRGWRRFALIFGMCDETFAVNCSTRVPAGVEPGAFMLWITFLNWFYWVLGAALGGILGNVLPFDTTGLEFVMTAMFVVIYLEQYLNEPHHHTGLIGFAVSVIMLNIFGADGFIIPSMLGILALLLAFRKKLEGKVQP